MGYSDQKYYARTMDVVVAAANFGTSTGAGTASNTLTSVATLPTFFRSTRINKIRLRVGTAPNVSATAVVAQVKNGTSVFGTVVLTTATASGFYDGVITSVALSTLAASVQPTIDVTGTFTASGGLIGTYDVSFETQEMPV